MYIIDMGFNLFWRVYLVSNSTTVFEKKNKFENRVTFGESQKMISTFDTHVGLLDQFVQCIYQLEIIGCNSFGKMNKFYFFR